MLTEWIQKIFGPAIAFLQNGTVPSNTYLAGAIILFFLLFGNIKSALKVVIGIVILFFIFSWLVSSGILILPA